MRTSLIVSKEEFFEILRQRLSEGEIIFQSFKRYSNSIEVEVFKEIEKTFNIWNSFNLELLKQSFDNSKNEYLQAYDNASAFDTESVTMVMRGANPDNIQFRIRFFPGKIEAKLEALNNLINKVSLIPSQAVGNQKVKHETSSLNKIFISHAAKDKDIVEEIIEALEIIGLNNTQIFCSSFEGYGIELGENFLERIKTELDSNVLVLFVLTQNFYDSPVCLCEMGASWIKTNEHIPIIVPPFEFSQIKGVIPLTQGFKINENLKFNSFKDKIEKSFNIENKIDFSTWERKRDRIIKRINEKVRGSNF